MNGMPEWGMDCKLLTNAYMMSLQTLREGWFEGCKRESDPRQAQLLSVKSLSEGDVCCDLQPHA